MRRPAWADVAALAYDWPRLQRTSALLLLGVLAPLCVGVAIALGAPAHAPVLFAAATLLAVVQFALVYRLRQPHGSTILPIFALTPLVLVMLACALPDHAALYRAVTYVPLVWAATFMRGWQLRAALIVTCAIGILITLVGASSMSGSVVASCLIYVVTAVLLTAVVRLTVAALGQAVGALGAMASAHHEYVYACELTSDGRLTWSTPPAALDDLLGGLPAGVSLDEAWTAAVHPEDRERYDLAMAAFTRDAPVELEYRLVGYDGVVRTVWDRGVAHNDGRERRLIDGVLVDVTERRGAAVALADAEARLSSVLDVIGVHVYSGVYATDGTEYREDYSGPGLERLLGGVVPPEADVGAVWQAAIHPDDRARIDASFRLEALAGHEHVEVEYRIVGLDGVVRCVRDRVRPEPAEGGGTRVHGIVTDVTDERAAAEELRRAQHRLETVVAAAGDALFELERDDDGGWRRVWAGDDVDALLLGSGRLDDDEAIRAWNEATHPDDLPRVLAFVEALGRGESSDVVYRVRRPADGELRWIWTRARPLPAGDGRPRVACVSSDVTDRQRIAEDVAASQRWLARVLEGAGAHVFAGEIVDGEYREIFTGPGLEHFLGSPVPGDGNAIWSSLIHPDDRPAFEAFFRGVTSGQAASDRAVEFRLRGPDGVTRWCWERISTELEPDGRLRADGLVLDVTERRRAVDELAAARDEADRRSRVDALTGVNNRWHFEGALRTELECGGAPAVVALDIDHFKRVNDAYGHRAGDDLLVAVSRRLTAGLPVGAVLARWGGEEFMLLLPGEDAARALDIAEAMRVAIGARPFPVADGDLHVSASAGVARAQAGEWSAEALIDAADAAMYAAKRRGRDRCLRWEDLDAADLLDDEPEVVRLAEALARSAGAREAVPELHAARVADLAVLVAEELGLPRPIVRRCRLGAWLHDVGKVAVPDRILMKPGPLDDAEWEVMRTHAAIGAQIVGRIPGLSDAALAVRHHHERYDGTGYPDRLASEAIPIEARVLAAVDAFSAMTSDRVYRAALDADAAGRELRRCAGTHLDPLVVDALLGVLELERAAA